MKYASLLSRRGVLSLVGATAVVKMARPVAAETGPAISQLKTPTKEALIERAFEMKREAQSTGDQGYGALIATSEGKIIGQAPSRVVVNHDPTAHAEMEAIRDAARRLGSRNLSGLIMYSSSRPCPMCEAAAYWANIDQMIYGAGGNDAGSPGLC